ncbi:hypothetical protein [Legionella cincinnatiensis]|uniref:Uncharacterized protein n=1 Tax=Legionella cincinnatiensis TaxID=28085 RepID=A0A378IIS6_9GAMM|nr:hypothetical protein [Legionella cincinnatiensis]KTC81797.1 hypothetical protein Lcin_2867 [Legionella cincinnatiensis]STX34605.1 Uncharacterised protein [Legionella cincinnatiensis]
MTQFAMFQQKAKRLAMCLAKAYGQHAGCLSFFSILIPDNAAMDDASTISLLAQSLDETYDLLNYVKDVKRDPKLTLDDFDEFRTKVIIGIYLLKWLQYNSIINSYLHQPLIDLFRGHLGVQSLEEINKGFFDSCLSDLSYYCTFVYERREEKTYSELNTRLGVTIQKDIHEAKHLSFHNDLSALYGIYRGIMGSLGLNM